MNGRTRELPSANSVVFIAISYLLLSASGAVADIFDTVATCDPDRLRAEIASGADPKARTAETALQYAAHSGWLEGVRLLLDNGADPRPANIHRARAWDFALRQGHGEVAELLASRQ